MRAYLDLVRDIRERFYNRHDPEALRPYLTRHFRFHGRSAGSTSGPASYIAAMAQFFGAIPDATMAEADAFASGGKVCVRAEIIGTHHGALWGIPSIGRRLHWSALFIYRFEGDGLAELWANEDWAAIFGAIGYIKIPFDR